MLQTGRDKDRQRFSTFLAEVELDRAGLENIVQRRQLNSPLKTVDELSSEMKRLLTTKENRRRQLAHAPFPEKIAALIRLQAMAARIERQRGRMVKEWSLPVRSETLMLHKKPYLKRTLITALVQPKAIEQ